MKYRGYDNNIYSSDNIDPEFLIYLYKFPVEFIEELYIAWKLNSKGQIKNQEILIEQYSKGAGFKIVARREPDFYPCEENLSVGLIK